MAKKVYCRNFVFGSRGPSSAVLVQDEDGIFYCGTVFFREVGGERVSQPSEAQRFCNANVDMIVAGIHDLEDDGIMPGWSSRPWTEQAMIDKAIEEAGWRE